MRMAGVMAVALGLAVAACAGETRKAPATAGAAEPFAVATAHLEQNATDGDVEVVFEVKGGADGLASLTITGPDGRTVASFTAPDSSTLGMRQLRLESPEPTDVPRLLAAYPEGDYAVAGATAAGRQYASSTTLHHHLPPPATVTYPADDATEVPLVGLRVTWAPSARAAAYIITLEQAELQFSLSARLPGSAAAFVVPDGVLRPGREYQIAIGTVTTDGNTSFVETTFATAGKE